MVGGGIVWLCCRSNRCSLLLVWDAKTAMADLGYWRMLRRIRTPDVTSHFASTLLTYRGWLESICAVIKSSPDVFSCVFTCVFTCIHSCWWPRWICVFVNARDTAKFPKTAFGLSVFHRVLYALQKADIFRVYSTQRVKLTRFFC